VTGDLFVAAYDSGSSAPGDRDRRWTTVANLAGLQPFGLVATRAGQLFVDTDHDPRFPPKKPAEKGVGPPPKKKNPPKKKRGGGGEPPKKFL